MNRREPGQRQVYMDHAATTPTHPEVFAAMAPYFHERFGNPSALYSIARESRKAVNEARGKVARALGASPEEIFFTAGGTEADNWAVKGAAFAHRGEGDHIITTAIEHHAVLHPCEYLESQGFSVTYLPVDRFGRVDPGTFEDAITDRTILASVMFANNEIGTIEPVEELSGIAGEHGVLFHCDAVQVIGQCPIDMDALGVDLLSLSAHKFYGPKGIGALYIRDGVTIDSLLHGGAQERQQRAGTENLPGIIGLGHAIERATADIDGHTRFIRKMRDRLLCGIIDEVPESQQNGHPELRLANNINLSFSGIDGEALLLALDDEGISASTGSACSSGSEEPSHVLRAIGLPFMLARGSLRLTLGDANSEEDIDYVLDTLPGLVKKLRSMAPR